MPPRPVRRARPAPAPRQDHRRGARLPRRRPRLHQPRLPRSSPERGHVRRISSQRRSRPMASAFARQSAGLRSPTTCIYPAQDGVSRVCTPKIPGQPDRARDPARAVHRPGREPGRGTSTSIRRGSTRPSPAMSTAHDSRDGRDAAAVRRTRVRRPVRPASLEDGDPLLVPARYRGQRDPSGATAVHGRARPSWRCRPPTSRTTGESSELVPPGRGLVKSHEELRLTVGERLRAGPLGEQLTPAGTGSAATENRSGRLVQRYVPPHGPGHQNALQGRGIVPPGTSDQPPDPGPDSSPSVLVRQRHLVSIVMGPAGRPALPSRPRQPRAAPIRARALHSSGIPTLFTVRRIAFYGTAVRLTRSVTMPTIAVIDGPTKI